MGVYHMSFELFDSDNHYYEPEDCLTRFGDDMVRQYVRWSSDGRHKDLIIGNRKTNDSRNAHSVMNPTFNKVAKPGAFHETLKAFETGSTSEAFADFNSSAASGELEEISPYYRNRDERLKAMDEQRVEKAVLFPTLGLTIEGFMSDEPLMMYKVVHAFNLWLDEDWGINRDGRIYSIPVVPMRTVEGAVAEVEWALARGAKAVSIQPGPAYGRSPADTYFDPMWARINEAGIPVTYHAAGGPTLYDDAFRLLWGKESNDLDYLSTFALSLAGFEQPMLDTARALILGNIFGRFPNLRVASIEMGSTWLSYFLHSLDHAGPLLTRNVQAFGEVLRDRPSDVFKEKFWVSPFPEEDVLGAISILGVDHVLMGSDWPHPEGTHTPLEYAECLQGLDDDSIRKVMRENAFAFFDGTHDRGQLISS
jgi:predicted TIM-barrel fold metal-dependent hydrolase